MVNYTPNLNLAKPTLSDVADITVISANFDILDSALAKMVTTNSTQTITGIKSFESSLYLGGNNYIKKSGSRGDTPSSDTQRWWMIQRGSVDTLNQASIGSVTGANGKRWLFASVYDTDGKYRDVSILRDTEIGAGSNGEHIVPLSYLNSESKATFLVHRAGTETLTGQKTFEAQPKVSMDRCPMLICDERQTVAGQKPANPIAMGINFFRRGEYSGRFAQLMEDSSTGYSIMDLLLKANMSSREGRLSMFETASGFDLKFWNGTAWGNLATTDTTQDISGIKNHTTHIRSRINAEEPIQILRSDLNLSDLTNTGDKGARITFYGKKDNTDDYDVTERIGTLRTYMRKSGHSSLYLTAWNGNYQSNSLELNVLADGSAYVTAPISPNAPSGALVTKAEVYGTNNPSNNLVHTISDESIDGIKTHLKMIPVLPVVITGNSGWRKVYGRFNPQSVTNTFIIEIIAGGEQYAMIEWRCKANTSPTGHYLVKSRDWTATVKLTRDTENNFLVWINDNRHTALYKMGRVSNSSTLTVVPEIPEDYETIYDEPTTSTYAHVTVIQ